MDIFSWIQDFADVVTGSWFNLENESYLGSAVNFFIYDTIKIGILLVVINYVMAITRYYFPMEKVRDLLTKRRWYGLDYLFAAMLGVITPFCSCSSVPLFIGFVSAGIPLGVTFTFLISSPLVNEASLYLFPALFGLKVTFLYNIVGIAVAVLGGMLINKLHVEKFIRPELLKFKTRSQVEDEVQGTKLTPGKLPSHFWQDGMMITKQIIPFVVIGVAIGALIHGFVPASFVEANLSTKAWWSIPLATLLGAPLYANSVSVIPVMEALVGKGVPIGTALAFMTAIVTLSIPEGLILNKVMRWQLLALFFSITVVGITLMGFVLNWLA
ncbi:MAG: permease [Anaerolineales bacterium]